ncbi:hypothetical protein KFL_002760190 [Klebsormidium nitens]|uniref:Uncharacterized protein n=1 Tax=Klebsormidium nitens TaxID=105231 RepID=A0A1Y1I6S6_KLENI|nr:hypothetical protein KFL_002760190 [Klebsormidium nitens]|eukprot:GAQ86223.1 hypothetical protein KFL_002760190 [Klebsormidium nitens]
MMEHEAAKATGRDRGRKRKLSGEQNEEGATSEQTASGSGVVAAAINIRTPETHDANDSDDSNSSGNQASSFDGDDCEGADDETSESDEEETASDRELLDDCPQQVDSAHDHRLADQEREIRSSDMVSST